MLSALIGGLFIGASASLAWSGAREIAGISGIVGRALRDPGAGFQVWFLVGLLLTGALLGRVQGPWQSSELVARPLPWIAVAGLLVGFGTQLGSGCTSGHGVCGMSRLAPRSIVATLTFMLVAGAVVLVTRHALAGSAIFGLGWGMSGYCPGPALVSLAFGRSEAALFVLAMLLGITAFRVFARRRDPDVSAIYLNSLTK